MKRHLVITSLVLLPSLAWAGATVSAERRVTRNRGSVNWGGQSAIDNNGETAWMVPGESANVGESITIQVPKGNVNGVAIWPGYGMSDDTFTDYARVHTMRIEGLCCEGDDNMTTLSSTVIELADENRLQFMDLEDFEIGNEMGFGGLVKMTVESVYEGRDYTAFGVSEARVVMVEFDLPAYTVASASGEDSDALNDGNGRTFWSSSADEATFSVSAGGYGISSVGITPGPATHARPKRVRVSANNRAVEAELENSGDQQFVDAPSITGYNGSAWGAIQVEVLEVYPGSREAAVAVSEVVLRATNFDGF